MVQAGVAAAVLLFGGSAWYQALVTPPYRFVDEQAHVGYVLGIQALQLPTIDTPIRSAEGGRELRERLRIEPAPRRDVWVANNPPFPYLISAVPAAITRVFGLPGGPLLGLRLLNVAAGAAAVAITYRLGRELAGGDARGGLVTAGLVAASPHAGFISALAQIEGLGLLVTVGILAALVRTCTAGPDRRTVIALGLWCAAGAATRPMSLVLAAAAGAIALGMARHRTHVRTAWMAGWLACPTVLTSGWWYLLNLRRYGDLTGSSALFEKFGRTPRDRWFDELGNVRIWSRAIRTLFTKRLQKDLPTDPVVWHYVVLLVLAAGVAGTLVLLARHGRSNRAGMKNHLTGGGMGPLPVLAWVAAGTLVAVNVAVVAQHRAGGGFPLPRYLLPSVPVVAAAVALSAVRLGTRWLAAACVVALATVNLRQTLVMADWLAVNPFGPGSPLAVPIGPGWVRGAGLIVAASGLCVLVAAILAAPNCVRHEGMDSGTALASGHLSGRR